MNVLMITGDKNVLKPGTDARARFELQASQVERLVPLFWGRGSLWPRTPAGAFDVVTVQDPFWRGLFALYIARRMRARLNVQVHTDLHAQPLLRHILAQIVLRHADSIRVVSEKIKKQVERIRVTVKITVLPVYVDIEKFKYIAHRAHSGKNILWLGRFEEEKDPLYAIEVLMQVLEDVPDARLTMLGDGRLWSEVEKKINEVMKRRHVQIALHGWTPDPRMYFETADIVLCTSKHESWGASMIEALAAGVPVVASDVGIAREAGAHIASHERLATKVVEVLKGGIKGELRIALLDAEAWAAVWKSGL